TYAFVTHETVVVFATFRMKSSAARMMPYSTAIVRSANTVRANVVAHTATVAHDILRSLGISLHSPMLYATTNRIAERTASGMYRASGAANRRTASRVSA